jgi:AcrR family transcriptional regulator
VAKREIDKRSRLIESAAKLVHERGFNRTTLADIAADSGVPLGNVYYYFKTKEAIGEALVERLCAEACAHRGAWDQRADPRLRLEAFVESSVEQREQIARHGCPMGSLATELHKDRGPVAEHMAGMMREQLDWLQEQFRLMGKGREAGDLAAHLFGAIQGATVLAHAFHDPRFITRESSRLKEWLRAL